MELLEAAKNVVKALEGDSRHAGLEVAYQDLKAAINDAEPIQPAVVHDDSGAVQSISGDPQGAADPPVQ